MGEERLAYSRGFSSIRSACALVCCVLCVVYCVLCVVFVVAAGGGGIYYIYPRIL